MKITEVETIWVGEFNRSWLFVRLHTDEGIFGLGEAGIWGYPEAAESVLKAFKRYLVGVDPLKIEHHWQYLYRNTFFLGTTVLSALSAVDVALWDIAGKYLGVPCFMLFGGKYRGKVRVYNHVTGYTIEQLVKNAMSAVKKGFTAVRFTPFSGEHLKMRYSEVMKTAVERVANVREALGDHVDICLEIGRRLSSYEAVTMAHAIEQYNPLFIEDPVPPDNIDAMAQVAAKTRIPIATGERLCTIYEFKELLERGAVDMVRPDIAVAGGLSHCKKIAALAEAFSVGLIPHNPLSPVTTASTIQLSACIPNFILQEYKIEDKPPRSEIVTKTLTLENGYLIVPDIPGIGVELNDKILDKYPYVERPILMPLGEDESVDADGTYTSEFRWRRDL
ncbi:MAG: galactonate dehydratase [Candidatus Helarchaeota archaeon]|nr:galactonate dehydratase [Candidatus Helarchaeota archaeon]